MPLAVMADTTVFSDTFTADSSIGSMWFNTYSTTAYTVALNTPNAGLNINVTSGTGKVINEFAQFTTTPVTLLTVGQYITLTVSFNSTSMAGNNGYLLTGLYNTQGSVATANLLNTSVGGGATANDTGYFGLLDFSTYANGSTKWYAKTPGGAASTNNELAYYSSMAANTYVQVLPGTYSSGSSGLLVNNVNYTMAYTIKKTASGNEIDTVITRNSDSVVMDNWSLTDSAGIFSSFDELDFGVYGKNGAQPNIDILSETVTTNVPEPATFALAGLGMLGLLLVRRVRR